MSHPTWIVPFLVYGPVTLRQRVRVQELKGFNSDGPFYSDIAMEPLPMGGFRASVSAFAKSETLARQAAALFYGCMLDVLCLRINRPLLLSQSGIRPEHMRGLSVQRVIRHDEFTLAFRDASHVALESPTFLRALGWYRKGLCTEDPFDSFFALWNAVEIVGSKYCPVDNERTRKGTKNQIYECFLTLWGSPDNWPIPDRTAEWISAQHDLRSDIAHGTAPVNVAFVESVLPRIAELGVVAHSFLCGWWNTQLPFRPSAPLGQEEE